MKFINFSDIENDIINIALAKKDIEEFWISKGIIENHLSLTNFIKAIEFDKSIYINKKTNLTVALSFIVTENDEYMFISSPITKEDEIFLFNHRYRDNLTEVDMNKLFLEGIYDLPNEQYFVMDGKFYH